MQIPSRPSPFWQALCVTARSLQVNPPSNPTSADACSLRACHAINTGARELCTRGPQQRTCMTRRSSTFRSKEAPRHPHTDWRRTGRRSPCDLPAPRTRSHSRSTRQCEGASPRRIQQQMQAEKSTDNADNAPNAACARGWSSSKALPQGVASKKLLTLATASPQHPSYMLPLTLEGANSRTTQRSPRAVAAAERSSEPERAVA